MRGTAVRLLLLALVGFGLGVAPCSAGEVKVGTVEVEGARGDEFRGMAVFPEEFLELERVEGPPVRVRFDQISRLVFKEVKRVERPKESLRAAFYHLERVSGGSGIDGFIRGARPVAFSVKSRRGVVTLEIGTETPVRRVEFVGNIKKFEQPKPVLKERKEPVLGRPSKEYTIVVPGNTSWMRTGINLVKGQDVHFTATGTIKWGQDPIGKEVGPDGHPHVGRRERPLPNRHLGMLVARIRPHAKAYGIGAANDFDTPASGELELGINDDELEDNTGNFRVRIVVDPN